MMLDLAIDCAAWDRAHDKWLAAVALMRAADRFGHSRKAMNALEVAQADAELRFGKVIHDGPTLQVIKDLRERADAMESDEYRRYVVPADAAGLALVLMPAPSFEAIHVKLAVIEEIDLCHHVGLSRPLFDVIEEDVRRLGFNVVSAEGTEA